MFLQERQRYWDEQKAFYISDEPDDEDGGKDGGKEDSKDEGKGK
jgi:hypothetical protein